MAKRTSKMYGGKFKGRQPESLKPDEWDEIRGCPTKGTPNGWALDRDYTSCGHQ